MKKKSGKRKKDVSSEKKGKSVDKVVAASSEIFFGNVEHDIKQMSDIDVAASIQQLMKELNLDGSEPASHLDVAEPVKKKVEPQEVKPTHRNWQSTLSPAQLSVIDRIEELSQEVGDWDPTSDGQPSGVNLLENDEDVPAYDLDSLMSDDVLKKPAAEHDWGIEIDPSVIGLDEGFFWK